MSQIGSGQSVATDGFKCKEQTIWLWGEIRNTTNLFSPLDDENCKKILSR